MPKAGCLRRFTSGSPCGRPFVPGIGAGDSGHSAGRAGLVGLVRKRARRRCTARRDCGRQGDSGNGAPMHRGLGGAMARSARRMPRREPSAPENKASGMRRGAGGSLRVYAARPARPGIRGAPRWGTPAAPTVSERLTGATRYVQRAVGLKGRRPVPQAPRAGDPPARASPDMARRPSATPCSRRRQGRAAGGQAALRRASWPMVALACSIAFWRASSPIATPSARTNSTSVMPMKPSAVRR